MILDSEPQRKIILAVIDAASYKGIQGVKEMNVLITAIEKAEIKGVNTNGNDPKCKANSGKGQVSALTSVASKAEGLSKK